MVEPRDNGSSNNNKTSDGKKNGAVSMKRCHPRRSRRRRDKSLFSFLGSMKLWIRSTADVCQQSLFFYPLISVVLAIIAGFLLTRLDQHLTSIDVATPSVLSTTVDSARIILSTVAGATISFAGTAFSVSLLVIQQGASQWSPRVVHTLFRDPFNKRVMGLVIGTFTFCLGVMRSVQDESVENGNPAIIPHISVALATILGIASILATVGFIDHAAHDMDISELLDRVSREAILQVRRLWTEEASPEDVKYDNDDSKVDDEYGENRLKGCHVVRFQKQCGWVQEINWESLQMLVVKDGFIKLHTAPGRYAIPGVPICTVSHIPADDGESDEAKELDYQVHQAVSVGVSRTNRDDAAYGLRQLVDVSLRAMSPGVNDPTTAQDAIFHAAAVVLEFLRRNPPSAVRDTVEGGKLVIGERHSPDSIVLLAYDEIRRCSSSSPTVCVYLLESLRLIRESLTSLGLQERAPEIERQARLIEEGCLAVANVKSDKEFIEQSRTTRFQDTYKEVLTKTT